MIAIDEAADGKTVPLAVGQILELRLPENPTTGFRWAVVSGGEPVCRIVAESFERGSRQMPGAGGTHVWRIEATRSGTCDFVLSNGRGWSKDEPGNGRFSVSIRADD